VDCCCGVAVVGKRRRAEAAGAVCEGKKGAEQ